jgi:hypothetical protein
VTGLPFAVYAACVDFMLQAARLFGVTYRDTNAFMFFVLWPLVTLLLILVVVVQGASLRRLRRAGGEGRTSTGRARSSNPWRRQ